MNDSNKILDKLTTMTLLQMYVGQTTQITTGSIEAKYLKNNMSLINTTQIIQDSLFSITSFSDLINVSSPLIINQKVILEIFFLLYHEGFILSSND